jgi:hypothetical protein
MITLTTRATSVNYFVSDLDWRRGGENDERGKLDGNVNE